MTWIGNLTAQAGQEQVFVYLSQVRTITVSEAGEGRLLAVLNVGAAHTVELRLTRERYSDLMRMLDVRDLS